MKKLVLIAVVVAVVATWMVLGVVPHVMPGDGGAASLGETPPASTTLPSETDPSTGGDLSVRGRPIERRSAGPPRARLPQTGSAAKPGIPDATKSAKLERWWVPMSPEDFAKSFEAEANAGRRSFAEFDTDGDGSLSETERLGLFDTKTMTLGESEMIRYFDSNGDGELSEIERAEGDAVMLAKNAEVIAETEAWIAGRSAYEAERLARFDADGDGQLNLDEAYAAYLDEVDTKAIDRFRQRYDADADGSINSSDLGVFMGFYLDKDSRADANDDGTVDELDIEAFEIMMSLQADG